MHKTKVKLTRIIRGLINKIDFLFGKLLLIIRVVRTFKNWPLYFLTYFSFFSSKKVKLKLRDGVDFYVKVDSLCRVPLTEIWAYSSYDFPGVTIGEHDIVVDIGANIGAFSIYAAKKALLGRVYAYEPDRENFELLNQNIAMNKLANISVFNLGVSSCCGTRNLYQNGNSVSLSLFHDFRDGNPHSLVKVVGIKEIFEENKLKKIDFLKIDAEGSEYEILFNIPNILLSRILKIVLEYHEGIFTEYNHEDIEKMLYKSGFWWTIQPQGSMGTGMIYAWRKNAK